MSDLPYLAAGGLLGAAAMGALNSVNQSQASPAPASTTSQYPPTHSFNLQGSSNMTQKPGGTLWLATADQAPILGVPSNYTLHRWAISAGLLSLSQGGVLEPHWHPNASELVYITKGAAAFTIFNGGPTIIRESFVAWPGELVFIPEGFGHDIENVSNGETRCVIAWNNERFDTIGLSGMVGASDPRVMDATFGIRNVQSTLFTGLNGGSSQDILIGQKVQGSNELVGPLTTKFASQASIVLSNPIPTQKAQVTSSPVPASVFHAPTNPVAPKSVYKYNLKAGKPAVATGGGTDTEGNARVFPALKGGGLACFSIVLRPLGIREPHWHPNAGELHFVVTGNMKWSVTSPGGATEKGQIGPGYFFFAPPGFLHYFENPSPSQMLHIAAFFTDPEPQDVGLSGFMSAQSDNVLGATFNLPPGYFTRLPRFKQDNGIVGGFRAA